MGCTTELLPWSMGCTMLLWPMAQGLYNGLGSNQPHDPWVVQWYFSPWLLSCTMGILAHGSWVVQWVFLAMAHRLYNSLVSSQPHDP
jgi:hypothetical protein